MEKEIPSAETAYSRREPYRYAVLDVLRDTDSPMYYMDIFEQLAPSFGVKADEENTKEWIDLYFGGQLAIVDLASSDQVTVIHPIPEPNQKTRKLYQLKINPSHDTFHYDLNRIYNFDRKPAEIADEVGIKLGKLLIEAGYSISSASILTNRSSNLSVRGLLGYMDDTRYPKDVVELVNQDGFLIGPYYSMKDGIEHYARGIAIWRRTTNNS